MHLRAVERLSEMEFNKVVAMKWFQTTEPLSKQIKDFTFNPCATMPIATKLKMNMNYVDKQWTVTYKAVETTDRNLYRAICITFLLTV